MNRIIWLLVILIACGKPAENKKKVEAEKKGKSKTDKQANGLVKSYTSDGKLYSAITYKNGIKDGISYSYYPNGQVNLELTYTNGKRTGQSKRYYETGQLYQTSEYKDNLLNGYQKKYRENGSVLSEIKFEKDEPCAGLKEFLLDNSEKKNFPFIIVTPVDELATKGKYTLKFSMSDKTKRVKYFIGNLTASGCMHNDLEFVLLNEKTGVGEITYNLPPGGFLMKEINIVARIKTMQGNTYITQKKYNLSLDN